MHPLLTTHPVPTTRVAVRIFSHRERCREVDSRLSWFLWVPACCPHHAQGVARVYKTPSSFFSAAPGVSPLPWDGGCPMIPAVAWFLYRGKTKLCVVPEYQFWNRFKRMSKRDDTCSHGVEGLVERRIFQYGSTPQTLPSSDR